MCMEVRLKEVDKGITFIIDLVRKPMNKGVANLKEHEHWQQKVCKTGTHCLHFFMSLQEFN